MTLYDCSLLISGLLNVFVFSYGFILMITKSIYRKHEHKLAACVEMINGKRVSTFAHITTKAIISITTSLAMVGIAIYVTITSEVPYNPFFAYDSNIAFAICFLLSVCIFNMVLMLLTETLCLRNLHEIPVYMVTGVVSIAILLREENAVAGVICLFMFGSILSDELFNIRSISFDSSAKRCNKGVQAFRLSMHILCNGIFPVIMFCVPTWFSKLNLFQMDKSSLIIFFFAVTFFICCSGWRLKCVLKHFFMKAKNEKIVTDPKSQADEWRPNAILVPMYGRNHKITKLVASRVYENKELLFKNSNNYFMIDNIQNVDDSTKYKINDSHNNIYKPNRGKIQQKQTVDTSTLEKIDVNTIF